jgi:predicted regulator of Ras-like GTPase activity (Roadblock/LC7/MglB family)
MFGTISKLFRKAETPRKDAPSKPDAKSSRATRPVSRNEATVSRSVQTPAAKMPAAAAGDSLDLCFTAILQQIPKELLGKTAPAGAGDATFRVAKQQVLQQLPQGSVKVPFGELRQAAPAGVLTSNAGHDQQLIDLPLHEILRQLHPDMLARRHGQRRVEVAEDVPDIFNSEGANNSGTSFRILSKQEAEAAQAAERQSVTSGKASSGHTTMKKAPVSAAPPPSPVVLPSPAIPARPAAPARTAGAVPIAKPAARPQPATAKPLPKTPGVVPSAAATAPSIPGAKPFVVSLDVLAEQWPDTVRRELASLKIPDAKCLLPPVEICEGLKRGRVQYPWKALRSWIQPLPIYATPSPHDEVILELPLKSLTPLFLQYIRENPVNRQLAAAENITDFFRRAEQAAGTDPELAQPLFAPSTPPTILPAPAPVPPAAASASRAEAPAAAAPEPSCENGFLYVPLALLQAALPENIQQDVQQFGLAESRIGFPIDSLAAGIKSARIEYSWRELCGWLNPASKPAQHTIHGEVRVMLPLPVIAPLFMKHRAPATRKKTAVDEQIPDLFSASGTPQAPPPDAGKPKAVAVPQPAAPAAAASAKKRAANVAELFGEPDKRSWTPNEIVERTAKLPGVVGALIALQDGLQVATSMPASIKSETLGAFMPQIYGRLVQYAKELQLGAVAALNFRVEAGTLSIYNAGIIYFAVLCKPGAASLQDELDLIAGELSRHTK